MKMWASPSRTKFIDLDSVIVLEWADRPAWLGDWVTEQEAKYL